MVQDPHNVKEFIGKVAEVATPRAEKDYQELLYRLQQEKPEATEVKDWQKGYISELIRQETYGLDSKEVRKYFQYDKVKQGLLDLTSDLFMVNIKPVDEEAWHPSVDVYEVWGDGELMGKFYLDMHPRKDKYKHAMMTTVVTGISGKQVPEAALVCNFPGGDDSPGLMEHTQVETFFHEFGHLIHHIFAGNQPWINISGIATEWDFVETPSTLYEEWAWNPQVLQRFAVSTDGETIPDALIQKMNQARKFRLGLDVKQQMFYAAISLNFYNREPQNFQPLTMVKKLQREYTPFDYVEGTHMHLSFGHLYGYSAIYYTYMWSTVIAKDLYSVFLEKGLANPEVSMLYRKKVLEPGGSKAASKLVQDFLGREFSFEAFAEWLNKDNI
jgi:thimet oligopeptidase